MIAVAALAGMSRTTRTLIIQAFLPREPPPLTGTAKQLAADLAQALRFARGAMMRARPIGGPDWCCPPVQKRLPFAWPAQIRLDGNGLYHPAYDTERRYCSSCHPKYADWAGEPVDPAIVPRSLRCPQDNRYWPNTVRRPRHGPLTRTWTAPGKVPRWYVWWRLWGAQDGHCATCPGPPQVIDHDHATGLLRGLLCYDCNTAEALCVKDLILHQHSGLCRFQEYWDSPPGAQFGWHWPDPNRQGGIEAFFAGSTRLDAHPVPESGHVLAALPDLDHAPQKPFRTDRTPAASGTLLTNPPIERVQASRQDRTRYGSR